MYCGSALISKNFPHPYWDVFVFCFCFWSICLFLIIICASYKGVIFKIINWQIYKFDLNKKKNPSWLDFCLNQCNRSNNEPPKTSTSHPHCPGEKRTTTPALSLCKNQTGCHWEENHLLKTGINSDWQYALTAVCTAFNAYYIFSYLHPSSIPTCHRQHMGECNNLLWGLLQFMTKQITEDEMWNV